MTINLITEEQHEELLHIQESYDVLNLQNVGYEYIPKKVLIDFKEQVDKVESILKEAVVGFARFNNFRLSKDGKKQVRFQYNWGADDDTRPFIGVGYLLIDELLYGFNKEALS